VLCKLCLLDRPLRRSHIVPEFLYRPLYGPKHTVVTLNPDLHYERRVRKGLTEPLLCEACEQRIQQFEDYFARRWYHISPLPSEIPPLDNVVAVSALDYQLFKLFHLSICWRASVSSLPDFSGVSLGPHEERIRAQLLAGVAGPAQEYQVLAVLVLRPGTRIPHHGLIAPPSRFRADGLSCYGSLYAACPWQVLISRAGLKKGALTTGGDLSLGVLDAMNIPGLTPGLRRWAKYIKNRLGRAVPPNPSLQRTRFARR